MSHGWRGAALALPGFFVLKVALGLLLLKASGLFLAPVLFPVFSQFLLLAALLNMLAVGGAQNGLVREVAAAGGDAARVARAWRGGVVVWRWSALLIGAPAALLAWPLAEVLTGRSEDAWAVPVIALLTFAAGPGQLTCAVLTGRGRVAASLAAQGAGLVAGTGAAVAALAAHAPLVAVCAFAAGPLVTLALGAWLVRGLALPPVPPLDQRRVARGLVAYSGAFVAVAASSALTFFAVRWAYRGAFGLDALGLWLVANRISDTSTQFLGLLMGQVLVPRLSSAEGVEGRRVLLACWAAGAGAMGLFLAVFALAPAFWVRVLLSAAYVPAVGFILAYMAGDVLRAWGSAAMHAAFARGLLVRYVTIEAATVALFTAITLALIAAGERAAPAIAYPAAYGVSAVIVTLVFLRRRASAAPAS